MPRFLQETMREKKNAENVGSGLRVAEKHIVPVNHPLPYALFSE